jgi:membrane protein
LDILEIIESWLWNPSFEKLSGPGKFAIGLLRFVYAVLRDAITSTLTLRAMGLVYVTILSVVPLLAITFSVLKGFGYHRQLEPLLYNLLAPLGARGAELTTQVMVFVDNIKGGVLAGIGLALLIYTSISMIKKVEDSFNYVFRVEHARGFLQRFSEYLSILLIGPVLMVTAMGLIAYVGNIGIIQEASSIVAIGDLILLIGRLLPYLLITFLFTFCYIFIPNTKVNFLAALGGGLTGGILWATTGMLFTRFVVGATRNVDIYASFAIVIVALMWLYISWLILLIGAQTAFYLQKPEYLRIGYKPLNIGNRLRERIGLEVMFAAARRFRDGKPAVTVDEIAAQIDQPGLVISPVLQRLCDAGLIADSGKEGLIPGRDPTSITISEVLGAIRNNHQRDIFTKGNWAPDVDSIDRQIDKAIEASYSGISVYDALGGNPYDEVST